MNETIYQAAAVIIPMVLAIVFHEVAHGWMALALGDTTARDANRLSLNPIRHVDPIGTILVPGVLKLAGGPVIGWAKPVPVRKNRLRNPRFGMMAVAAAGPGTNLVLALAAAVGLGLLLKGAQEFPPHGSIGDFVLTNLRNFLSINIFLALFNLLPVPPFDGSHIVEGLLPERAARAYERLRPFGFPIMLVLLIVLPSLIPGFDPVGKLVMPVFEWVGNYYIDLANAIAGAGPAA